MKNSKLLSEIDETKVANEKIVLWWLGQSGFVIKMGKETIYIDPYLSNYCKEHSKLDHTRLMEIPIQPESISNASIVICSHDHSDHLDPDTVSAIAKSSPEAIFISPIAAKKHLINLGIAENRVLPTNAGKLLKMKEVTIYPVAAKHEEFDKNEETGFPYQGYVINCDATTIYHAGDCIPYEGLVKSLLRFNIDIALLPINGRDEKRHELGFEGNFTYQEACQLALEIKSKVVIPMHYGMFALNNEDVSKFISYIEKNHPSQEYKVLKCGQQMVYKK